jgi:ribonuclease PH
MSANKIVYNILSNNAALTALISTRLNPVRIPQESAFPAVSYNLISQVPNPTKSGHSRTEFARVQVNAYGTSLSSAQAVASAIRTAFEAVTLPGTFNGIKCQTLEYDGENQTADDTAAFAGLYQISQDYLINFTR